MKSEKRVRGGLSAGGGPAGLTISGMGAETYETMIAPASMLTQII